MKAAPNTLCPALFVLLSLSCALGQGVPDLGQWVTGPLGNRHDLSPDAVTSSQLAIGGAVITNQASTFLGCKGGVTPPVLELRFLVPAVPRSNASAISKSATLAIDDDSRPVSIETFLVQNKNLFVIPINPEQATRMASLTINQRASLYLHFEVAGQKGFFLTTLMDPTGPVSTVLTACGVNIPARPSAPADAATPAMMKFTFQGIHLGMNPQQALAAEKAIATTPIKPSPGGGVDFETPQFYYISVSADDNGLLEFYKVCGKTSRTAKAARKAVRCTTWRSKHSGRRPGQDQEQ